MNATPTDTQDLAWNGLTLTVPAAWRPAGLGLRHLLLEDDHGPVFEWKWRPGAGREGMEAALRALTPKRRARAAERLPEAWIEPLADYESMPLTWARDGRTGQGAALFHPATGTAAVFQAYGGPDGPDPARLAAVGAVLASLRHDRPGPLVFRLYGLCFTAPEGFALADFAFVPGRFSLSLAAGRRRLDVVRLAPADVLLAGESLAALAARTFGLEAGVPETGTVAGCPAVWLAERQGRGGFDALLRLLGRPGRLVVLRHDASANKLWGAACAATKPVDRDWLAAAVTGCVAV